MKKKACNALESETVFREGFGYFIRCANCYQELVHKTSFDGRRETPICANGHYIAQNDCGFCQRKLERQKCNAGQ